MSVGKERLLQAWKDLRHAEIRVETLTEVYRELYSKATADERNAVLEWLTDALNKDVERKHGGK